VRKLRARSKIALTGTPLENNLMDLWSLLSITAPGLFPDPKAFTAVFRKPIEGGDLDALARLHRRIKPLILRRTKAAVAAELPEKQEQLVPVELAPAHRRLYDRYLARERQKVLGLVDDLARNRITILRSLTCCASSASPA
jgi:SNF2 family DNA or RNA helicase